jgi:hypothetical protein
MGVIKRNKKDFIADASFFNLQPWKFMQRVRSLWWNTDLLKVVSLEVHEYSELIKKRMNKLPEEED